jgi:hypothetical protein
LARFDLYDPYDGGFRAPLAADFGTAGNAADLGKVWAVALNGTGKIVKVNATAGQTHADCCGLLVLTQEKYAGDVVDIMTDGQIADIGTTDGIVTPAAGGKVTVAAANDGSLAVAAALTAGTNYTLVGRFVEATRLIVRVRPVQG